MAHEPSRHRLKDRPLVRRWGDRSLEVRPLGDGVFHLIWKDPRGSQEKVVVVEGDEADLEELPAYPSRPVRVVLTPPVSLAAKGKARLFVSVPLDVELLLREPGHPPVHLLRISPHPWKEAWFGDRESGMLVYHHRSPVIPRLEGPPPDDPGVWVPLQIENMVREVRELDAMVLDTYQLSLYLTSEGVPVAEEVDVKIRDQEVEVRYTDRKPGEADTLVRHGMESVRELGLERLARRSFRLLLSSIPGLGGRS